MSLIQFVPVAAATAVTVARMREIRVKRNTIAGKIRERWTLRIFIAVGTVTYLAALAEYFLMGGLPAWGFVAVGSLTALFSFWLRARAITALGRFWSLHVEIRENHEFVKTGPFRWVRHPVYLSMILELASICLILRAWTTLLIVPVIFIPALVARLSLEEAAMIEKFGERYREYRRTVPAIFPYKGPCA